MLSIVTITFNNLAGLRDTAKSVLPQLNEGIEWIIVDGDSKDGTKSYLDELRGCAHCISERDRGIYDAMYKGLLRARRSYIIFLNAGDQLATSEVLAEAVSRLDGKDAYFFSASLKSGETRWLRAARPLSSARYSVPAVQQATIYRVECLRQLAWPMKYKICGDYFLAAQLLKNNKDTEVSSVVLATFELGGVSTSSFLLLANEAYQIQRNVLKMGSTLCSLLWLRRVLTGSAVFVAHWITRGNRK